MVQEFAPAKVNLTLHITGQRDDGYHLLDSLVMFADIGDTLDFFDANTHSLTVDGPEAAGVPVDMDNSIMQAVAMLGQASNIAVLLTKNLPSAAGIGGGSADAAAALRGVIRHNDISPDWLMRPPEEGEFTKEELEQVGQKLLSLGADVPVCFFSQTARMRGIGEQIDPLPGLPQLDAVLVNPRVQVSTPDVFKRIEPKTNPGHSSPPPKAPRALIDWLAAQRNDMEDAARSLAPEIGTVLEALRNTDSCHLTRMSGSGATCFGLYPDADLARKAANQLSAQHPGWWVKPCRLGDAPKA
jgi:4-diphosphocytidyl-2-C-methyl-D-erythritol kinase